MCIANTECKGRRHTGGERYDLFNGPCTQHIIAKTEDCFEKLHDEQKIGQQFFDVHGFLHQKAATDFFPKAHKNWRSRDGMPGCFVPVAGDSDL